MEDPKSKKVVRETHGAGGPQGVGVPAKGDSSASNPPFDPLEGATISDIPPTPAPASAPPAKPATREVAPEATISDSLAASLKSPSNLRRIAQSHTKEAVLQPGDLVGGRYEILELLGEGGMGAVYKALDRSVEQSVALKLIRPELASNPAILARFKQELLTARQVTHKNVVRIYDLAEAEGIQFITMEFVEGSDLRRILISNGKLPPEKAIEIIRQVCLALDAAHSAGIIHRDLKPQNIMQETKTGRIVVMDFGLARSMESGGMTQTGALLGTIEYMSPEQSMGRTLDQRSDIFAVGLIFYEMLTGKTPYNADSAMASLLRRNQERAVPVAQLDSTVPKALSDIVAKCLERDLDQRYQNVQQILAELDAYQGARPTLASIVIPTPAPVVAKPTGLAIPWKWAAGGLVAVLLVAGGIAFNLKGPAKSSGPHAPVSVLVADFTNHTGDPIFDGTLEPMFNVALEGASFINAYNRGSARKLAQKLPNPSDKLDEQPARLVALSQGISTVIAGEISRRGNNYAVSAIALDAATGNVIAKAEATAPNKDEVVGTVPKLVAPIRKALGDTTPEAAQLEHAGGAFTAASLEVVHQYGVAMDQQFAGKTEEALKSFAKAAELDPNFARAYSGMTAAAIKLDRRADSEKYIKSAMEHVDRMTDRERYRVRGLYYGTSGNWQKCAEEYSALVKAYPGDNIGHNNLAVCLSELRNLPKAIEEARLDNEMRPNLLAHVNVAMFLSYAGDFQGGEREAREIQRLYPTTEDGYQALAFAQLGQGQLPQAEETYSKLEKLSPHAVSVSALGLADLALYQGRFADAVRRLDKGASADLAEKDNDSAAEKFAALAYAQMWMQRKGPAIAAAEKALANGQTIKIRFLAARVFVEAGQPDKAQKLASGLASDVQSESQGDAKMIEGNLALKRKDARQAIKSFTDANALLDTWLGHFELGRAYLEANAFAEADSEFDQCLRRRGEVLSLFMDALPSYGYLPPVYYYQGRVREGLKSAGYAESYRNYLSIRGQAGEDPLLPEIHRRLGQ